MKDIGLLVDCMIKGFSSLQSFSLGTNSSSSMVCLCIDKLSHFMRLPVSFVIDTGCLDMDFSVTEFLDFLDCQIGKDIRLRIDSWFHEQTSIADWRRLVRWPVESVEFSPAPDFEDYH